MALWARHSRQTERCFRFRRIRQITSTVSGEHPYIMWNGLRCSKRFISHVKDERAFLPHVGVMMGFVNVLRELRASITNPSSAPRTGLWSNFQASKQPIQLEDPALSTAQLRMSHSESQPDSSQTDSVKPTVNADGQIQERFRWLVTKLGLYIVSVFFPAMSRRFCHPASQRLFEIISSIDSTAVANAFNVYAKDNIRRSPPSRQDIRLLRLLRTEGFADFVQAHSLSIRHLQVLTLAPGSDTLYTQETCSEFHSLLCGLLRGYSDALSSLMAQCGSTMLSLEEFKQKVQDTYTYLKPLVIIAYSPCDTSPSPSPSPSPALACAPMD